MEQCSNPIFITVMKRLKSVTIGNDKTMTMTRLKSELNFHNCYDRTKLKTFDFLQNFIEANLWVKLMFCKDLDNITCLFEGWVMNREQSNLKQQYMVIQGNLKKQYMVIQGNLKQQYMVIQGNVLYNLPLTNLQIETNGFTSLILKNLISGYFDIFMYRLILCL